MGAEPCAAGQPQSCGALRGAGTWGCGPLWHRAPCSAGQVSHRGGVPLCRCHTVQVLHCASIAQCKCHTVQVSHSAGATQCGCHTVRVSHSAGVGHSVGVTQCGCHTVQVWDTVRVWRRAVCDAPRCIPQRAGLRTCSPVQPLRALSGLLLAPSCGNGAAQHARAHSRTLMHTHSHSCAHLHTRSLSCTLLTLAHTWAHLLLLLGKIGDQIWPPQPLHSSVCPFPGAIPSPPFPREVAPWSPHPHGRRGDRGGASLIPHGNDAPVPGSTAQNSSQGFRRCRRDPAVCAGAMEKGSRGRMRPGQRGGAHTCLWQPGSRKSAAAAAPAPLYQRPDLAGGWEKLSGAAVVWRRARG